MLALLTQWLGAFLILARGDLSRLTAAIVLMASGQIAGAVLLPASAGSGVAWLVSAGLIVPVAAIASLLAWLQQTYGSHEFNDYHGLSRVLPRFSAALTVAVLWFCGVPLLSVFPGLWAIWMHRIPFAGLETFALWIVLVPQLIAAWGGLRILDGLLLGEPRLPKMPEILNDRIEIHGGIRLPDRDLERPELSAAAILVAIGLLLGLGGFSAFLGADPVAAEAVDPQPADSL
jgi:NADH:ubiquinone oxidoreductase subunit 2 (subunit N)